MVVGSIPTSGAFINFHRFDYMATSLRALIISSLIAATVFVSSVILSIVTYKPPVEAGQEMTGTLEDEIIEGDQD